VEPRVSRVLLKHGIELDQLMTEGSLESTIARRAFPPGTEQAIQELKLAIEQRYPPVIRAATAIDPTLEGRAGGARRRALFELDALEKKLLQHARKRESVDLGQVALARTSLRPLGKPQERVISLSGFLARYGPSILEELADHIARWYG